MQIGRRNVWALLILALVLALVCLRPLDRAAEEYTESGLKRAFATFAAARAMNATISVLKSTQVGAGASFQPGAVLDPIDDLIEQFSAIMLMATLSFATQRLLIDVFGAWPVSMLVTALFLGWAVAYLRNWAMPSWLPKLALGLLCLRLAVPAVALGSEITYRFVLAGKYETSQAQITTAAFPEEEVRASESIAERVKRWWAKNADIGKLKERAETWVEHIVRLIVVFIVQTVVLPLLFLWATVVLYRALSAPFRTTHPHSKREQHVPQLPHET